MLAYPFPVRINGTNVEINNEKISGSEQNHYFCD
nr:MAG TPA: hypothetical protein [Caudoviricetes sp.]